MIARTRPFSRRDRSTAAATIRYMSRRLASTRRPRRSPSTASSTKRSGSRRRGSPISRSTRRSTAVPPRTPTEVLVFYSPTAIYFGIKAHAAPGAVHATLANRDRIDADDAIQIFLNPFKDGRQALVFGVNPLGIQADGALVEGTGNRGGAAFGALESGREVTDLTPDYVFQSKGRLTDYGYEIEIAIPFKTLRFPADRVQSWALNVVRRVQSSGHEDSWTPALRAKSSFLAQSGTLDGLTDLRRGLVLDLNPVATAHADGAPAGRRLAVRHQPARVRRQRALGRHAEPDAERHGQPRLLAGRGRRQPVHVRSAQRAVLPGEAPVLPRRRGAVQRAEQPDLHAADRRAGDRRQADRQELGHRHRAALGGRRSGDVGHRRRSSGVQHRAHAARPAAIVEGRPGLHRPDRRRPLQPRVRRRRAAAVRIDLQPAAAGRRQPHGRRRTRDDRADLAGDRSTATAAISATATRRPASTKTFRRRAASSAAAA